MNRITLAAGVALCPGVALGGPTVVFSDGAGSTNGGIFIAATGDRGTFDTFCVELDEYIYFNTQYYYTISDQAENGGNDDNDGDPISQTTRNIFAWFLSGQIDDQLNNFSLSPTQIADAVQESIWQEEENYSNDVTGYAGTLRTLAANAGIVAGSLGVKVMNVWTYDNGTGNQQDSLIWVPLPPAAGLAGLGLGAVAVRRRRSVSL